MNYIDIALRVIPIVISFGLTVVVWFSTRRKDVDNAITDNSNLIDDLSKRTATLEQTVQSLPAKDDMHRLELTLGEIGGDMKAIRATMKGMSESMSRTERSVGIHEEHLMKGGKK
jgi:hypothetical protein